MNPKDLNEWLNNVKRTKRELPPLFYSLSVTSNRKFKIATYPLGYYPESLSKWLPDVSLIAETCYHYSSKKCHIFVPGLFTITMLEKV